MTKFSSPNCTSKYMHVASFLTDHYAIEIDLVKSVYLYNLFDVISSNAPFTISLVLSCVNQ